jgi:hypothetical protein
MKSTVVTRCTRNASCLWVLLLPGKVALREISPLRARFGGRTAISHGIWRKYCSRAHVLRPVPWEKTLDLFLHRVKATPLHWFLSGRVHWLFVGSTSDPAA